MVGVTFWFFSPTVFSSKQEHKMFALNRARRKAQEQSLLSLIKKLNDPEPNMVRIALDGLSSLTKYLACKHKLRSVGGFGRKKKRVIWFLIREVERLDLAAWKALPLYQLIVLLKKCFALMETSAPRRGLSKTIDMLNEEYFEVYNRDKLAEHKARWDRCAETKDHEELRKELCASVSCKESERVRIQAFVRVSDVYDELFAPDPKYIFDLYRAFVIYEPARRSDPEVAILLVFISLALDNLSCSEYRHERVMLREEAIDWAKGRDDPQVKIGIDAVHESFMKPLKCKQ